MITAVAATVPAPVRGAIKESRAAKAAAGEDIYICYHTIYYSSCSHFYYVHAAASLFFAGTC